MALVKEQQKLLRQYRELDRQTCEMVDKVDRLSDEMKLLSTDFSMVLNKSREYEALIAALQSRVQRLEIELEAACDRLVKVHAGILASSQNDVSDELYKELLAVIDVRVTESV
jgi:chromosome segregation ATPase